jgi:glycosyltransferase involved in cell wall biosynthesis
MATGKPVVATDIRGCREEVAHGRTGLLVPAGDPPALAGAICHLLRTPNLAHAMGLAGRKRAECYFNERKVVAQQVNVYSRLVQERLPSRYSAFLASETIDGQEEKGSRPELPGDRRGAAV